MNKLLRLSCNEVMDEIYKSQGNICDSAVAGISGEDETTLLQKLRVSLHIFFCTRCAEEISMLEKLNRMPRSFFFPPAPSFEEKVMAAIAEQPEYSEEYSGGFELLGEDPISEAPGGLSFRSWVVIGFIIFISLASSFFGTDFIQAAFGQDSSFLIPLGITVGTVLTGYGAFFIASHLKELTEHFKIH